MGALIAAPAAFAGTPSGDRLGDSQELDIQASPPVAGAGIVFDLQQTYWNVLGLPALRAPAHVVFHFPRGAAWNGPLFPQCNPARLVAAGPRACPPNSRFATADAVAAVALQAVTITAKVTDFVGTPLGGQPTQLLYVVPQIGSPFVLTAVVRDEPSGPYGLALDVDLGSLPGPTALAPSPIIIVSLHNVDMHTSVARHVAGRLVRTPLIVAPPTCNGFWSYAVDSVYPSGPPLRSTTRQPCVPAPPGVLSRPPARRRGRGRHVHKRPRIAG